MNAAMAQYPWAWLYFVSYVVLGTFVVINLFIAIIINSLDDAKRERLAEADGPVTRERMLRELQAARETLNRLERRLESEDDMGKRPPQ